MTSIGMTGGEIALVLMIFGLIYAAGLLPKIAAALSGEEREPRESETAAAAASSRETSSASKE